MEYKHFKNYMGELVKVPYLENGHALCPVCSCDLEGLDPYYDDESPSYEICPDCNVQFGVDDMPRQNSGLQTTEEQLLYKRCLWLEKNGWDNELLVRMQKYLCVDIDQLLKHRNAEDH